MIPPPEKASTPVATYRTADLRQLWQQALADKTPGISPDEVFDTLERKYHALADQTRPSP